MTRGREAGPPQSEPTAAEDTEVHMPRAGSPSTSLKEGGSCPGIL